MHHSNNRGLVLRVEEALADALGPQPIRGRLDSELRRNVEAIIDETVETIRDGRQQHAVTLDYFDPSFVATAELRAAQNHHPAESLMAAELLFDVALHPVTAAMEAEGYDLGATARALHHAIWRRFPPGAIAYTNMLRSRLNSAERDTRAAIARDLHDRVAHGMLTALQRVELAGRLPDDATRANMLAIAASLLRDAIGDVRSVASRLREQVGESDLRTAIERYAEAVVAGTADLTITGDGVPLAPWQEEEILAITLEAVRNAIRHARANTITVHLNAREARLAVTITDNGAGIPDGHEEGLGLTGMRERANLLGADLTITSTTAGTTITLLIDPVRTITVGTAA